MDRRLPFLFVAILLVAIVPPEAAAENPAGGWDFDVDRLWIDVYPAVGKAGKIGITVVNTGNQAGMVKALLTIQGPDGRTELSTPFPEIPKGDSKTVRVDWTPKKAGAYTVLARIVTTHSSGHEFDRATEAYTVAQPRFEITDAGVSDTHRSVPARSHDATPGSTVRLWYEIKNPFARSVEVKLEATVEDASGRTLRDDRYDACTLSANQKFWCSRHFKIPADAAAGTARVRLRAYEVGNEATADEHDLGRVLDLSSEFRLEVVSEGPTGTNLGQFRVGSGSFSGFGAAVSLTGGHHRVEARPPSGLVFDRWTSGGKATAYPDSTTPYIASVRLDGDGWVKAHFKKAPTFELRGPEAATWRPGEARTLTYTVVPSNGFTGRVEVALAWPDADSRWMRERSPTQHVDLDGTSRSVDIRIVAAEDARPGLHRLVVSARSGDLRSAVDLAATVTGITPRATLTDFDTPARTLRPGEEAITRVQLRNDAEGTAEYRIVLRHASASGDTQREWNDKVTLKTGASEERVWRWTVPADAAAGPYRTYVAVYSGDSLLFEDLRESAFTVQAGTGRSDPKPTDPPEPDPPRRDDVDARIASFDPPRASLLPESSTTTTVSVENTGDVAAAFLVRVTYTRGGSPVATLEGTTATVEPGANGEVRLRWEIPEDAPAGTYRGEAEVFAEGKRLDRDTESEAFVVAQRLDDEASGPSSSGCAGSESNPSSLSFSRASAEVTCDLDGDRSAWYAFTVSTESEIRIRGASDRSEKFKIELHDAHGRVVARERDDKPSLTVRVPAGGYRLAVSSADPLQFNVRVSMTELATVEPARLVVEDVDVDAETVAPGMRQTVRVALANEGDVDATVEATVVFTHRRSGTTYDLDETLNVKRGDTSRVKFVWKVPVNAPPGEYAVSVHLGGRGFTEVNEPARRSFEVEPAYRLEVVDVETRGKTSTIRFGIQGPPMTGLKVAYVPHPDTARSGITAPASAPVHLRGTRAFADVVVSTASVNVFDGRLRFALTDGRVTWATVEAPVVFNAVTVGDLPRNFFPSGEDARVTVPIAHARHGPGDYVVTVKVAGDDRIHGLPFSGGILAAKLPRQTVAFQQGGTRDVEFSVPDSGHLRQSVFVEVRDRRTDDLHVSYYETIYRIPSDEFLASEAGAPYRGYYADGGLLRWDFDDGGFVASDMDLAANEMIVVKSVRVEMEDGPRAVPMAFAVALPDVAMRQTLEMRENDLSEWHPYLADTLFSVGLGPLSVLVPPIGKAKVVSSFEALEAELGLYGSNTDLARLKSATIGLDTAAFAAGDPSLDIRIAECAFTNIVRPFSEELATGDHEDWTGYAAEVGVGLVPVVGDVASVPLDLRDMSCSDNWLVVVTAKASLAVTGVTLVGYAGYGVPGLAANAAGGLLATVKSVVKLAVKEGSPWATQFSKRSSTEEAAERFLGDVVQKLDDEATPSGVLKAAEETASAGVVVTKAAQEAADKALEAVSKRTGKAFSRAAREGAYLISDHCTRHANACAGGPQAMVEQLLTQADGGRALRALEEIGPLQKSPMQFRAQSNLPGFSQFSKVEMTADGAAHVIIRHYNKASSGSQWSMEFKDAIHMLGTKMAKGTSGWHRQQSTGNYLFEFNEKGVWHCTWFTPVNGVLELASYYWLKQEHEYKKSPNHAC